jgi:hypothetical protein
MKSDDQLSLTVADELRDPYHEWHATDAAEPLTPSAASASASSSPCLHNGPGCLAGSDSDLDARFHATMMNELQPESPAMQFACPSNFAEDVIAPLQTSIADFLDRDESGRASTLYPPFLTSAYPEFVGMGLAQMLLLLILRCLRNQAALLQSELLDFVEYAAGQAELTYHCVALGFRGARFDIAYSKDHDVLTPLGLRLWMDYLSECKKGALVWFGTRCSSFVFVSRGPSGRRQSNDFVGDEAKSWVKNGNDQAAISSLLFFIAFKAGLVPTLEQPCDSCMPKVNPLAHVFNLVKATRVVTWLGAFGGLSPKPIQIWSSSDIVRELRRGRPIMDQKEKLVTVKNGKVTGTKAMKQSQAYPPQFGAAVAAMLRSHVAKLPRDDD